MRVLTIIVLSVILAGVSAEIYFIFREYNQLNAELMDLNRRFDSLAEENQQIRSDIEYFSYPENMEKELRLKFNYKKPDEEMIIVVP